MLSKPGTDNRDRMDHHWQSEPRAYGSIWNKQGLRVAHATRTSADLGLCAVLTLVAAAATFLADGNALRLLVVLPVLLTVPGYLLLQVLIVPAAPPLVRWMHALVGFGLSPAVIGLLALTTSILPGGFRASTIIATVTLTSLGLAALAVVRRSTHPQHDVAPTVQT